MKYLNGSLALTLRADNQNNIKWYVDAAFAVHPDFRSHTGMVMTMGKGGIINNSRKQKLNTDSSTTAELIALHNSVKISLWTKLFLEAQGYGIKKIYYIKTIKVLFY